MTSLTFMKKHSEYNFQKVNNITNGLKFDLKVISIFHTFL